jgi:hypothetical protein
MSNATNSCPTELPAFCQQRHWSIYWIIIVCSLATIAGRVMTVQNYNSSGDTTFFSANDRSRWATVRSLGDSQTYEIDSVIQRDQPIYWDTIDKVKHLGQDGRMHSYSSKPTLLPTLVSGIYVSIKSGTGKDLANDPVLVSRMVMLLTNVLPWGIYLYFLAKLIDRVPVRDWSRYFVLGCAGFGTFLSTFSNSLNNHVPAAISVMIALYMMHAIWRDSSSGFIRYFCCGLFAAFGAANEMPAMAFLACAALLCVIRSFKWTVIGFVPGLIIVAAGFFGTNYLAHGDWKPAYAHRGDGELVAEIDGAFAKQLDDGELPVEILDAATAAGFDFRLPTIRPGDWPSTPEGTSRWIVSDRDSDHQFVVMHGMPPVGTFQKILKTIGMTESKREIGGFQIRRWSNWYEYPESYWLKSQFDSKSEVDRGQAKLDVYAFHLLFGHHGIFSLTPIWIFSLAGMFVLLGNQRLQLRWLGMMAIAISAVVFAFYLLRPEIDRNYGGVTSGLRWMFWLAPIWLVCMLPIVEWLGRTRNGRFICLALLIISALSAAYSQNNPWVHPWLYEIWDWTTLPK